jgi:predicted O-methyltransferase YrrM
MTMYPNWFELSAKANFEKFLGKEYGLTALQLGVYTGDASLWMLENLEKLQLTDVDTWQGSDEEAHKSMDFSDVEKVYDEKVKSRTIKCKSTTVEYLTKELALPEADQSRFDFIYIDADHTTVGVLTDAELSWPLLKSGGIMAFDDYTWGQELPPELAPALGIDLFLSRHLGEYKVLAENSQVWIQKNDN